VSKENARWSLVSPSYTCSGNNAVEKVYEISIALPINIDNAYLQE